MPEEHRSELWRQRRERFERDRYANLMGFSLVEARPGYACVSTALDSRHLNFTGTPHGGLIFSLADYAFAVASNSHGQVAVATNVTIQFLGKAQVGDCLSAVAREIQVSRRVGFYEMEVRDGKGNVIARCLGTVQRSQKTLEDLETE